MLTLLSNFPDENGLHIDCAKKNENKKRKQRNRRHVLPPLNGNILRILTELLHIFVIHIYIDLKKQKMATNCSCYGCSC